MSIRPRLVEDEVDGLAQLDDLRDMSRTCHGRVLDMSALLSSTTPRSTKSLSRPGVATTRSAPSASALACARWSDVVRHLRGVKQRRGSACVREPGVCLEGPGLLYGGYSWQGGKTWELSMHLSRCVLAGVLQHHTGPL